MGKPVIGLTTYRKISKDTNANLYSIATTYVRAIGAAGGIPLLIPLGLSEDALEIILERIDGLILPGGDDINPRYYQGIWHENLRGIDTDRDKIEIFLTKKVIQTKKPLLAICRGHQILNVALGGTLYEDVLSQMSGAIQHDYFLKAPSNFIQHTVDINPESRLVDIMNDKTARVNSLHHQGVRDLAPDLVPTAVAPDGLVEAVELPTHPFVIGVQWHPEHLIDDPAMLALFQAHVTAASANGN